MNYAADAPAHIEETVNAIAELHAEHDRRASLYQRALQRLIERLEQPASIAVIAVIMVLWVGVNLTLVKMRLSAFDPPPFSTLQGLVTCAALFTTVLILASQQHENRLAERRAQLTLELAMISDQKVAKLIELIEHQRRDNPQMADRVDDQAEAMSKPSDARALHQAVQDTHGEMLADNNAVTPKTS